MDPKLIFQQAYQVAILDEPTMKKVAADKDALPGALLMVGISALATALGRLLFPMNMGIIVYRPDWMSTLGIAVTSFCMSLVTLFVVGYLAKHVFNSKLPPKSFVQVVGMGHVVGIFNLIPAISFIGVLWLVVIFFFTLRKLDQLSWGSIVLLLLLTFVVMAIFGLALDLFGFSPLYHGDFSFTKF